MGSISAKIIPNNLSFNDIRVGQVFSFEVLVDKPSARSFAKLTGDKNPLHLDDSYAQKTEFGEPIAQGMLLGSFFSTLVGMLCPGKNALYLSQDLRFRNPLKFGQMVIVAGVVSAKYDTAKIMDIKTTVKDKHGTIIVDGLAKVKVRYE